jgi:hypothetical protein
MPEIMHTVSISGNFIVIALPLLTNKTTPIFYVEDYEVEADFG